MITFTGDGLNIVVRCEYVSHHHWMTFAAWYSFSKNLPDAKVSISCERKKSNDRPLFGWVNKIGVPFSYGKLDGNLILPPDVMAIRKWESDKVYDAKENQGTFVSYNSDCADFVMREWIDKLDAPFMQVDHFKTNGMSVNEMRILSLWDQLLPVYSMIG